MYLYEENNRRSMFTLEKCQKGQIEEDQKWGKFVNALLNNISGTKFTKPRKKNS